ncbi:MAG: cation transporter [Clostridiales bacterium]|nr:cation transporter [Clostridiales bacterium]
MGDYRAGILAARVAIVVNIMLCIFKIGAGILGKSKAMLADGIHTLSDVLATSVALVGLRIASKDADEDHQYGHERYEPLFAKIISTILIITGFFIGYGGIRSLIEGNTEAPGMVALVAALVSVAVKEGLYWNTIRAAKRIDSISLEADAWHHRSDALSSIGTFVGILLARLGLKFFDPIAAVLVSLLILKLGVEFWIKASAGLVDTAAPDKVVKKIEGLTMGVEGVLAINSLKTRVFGNRLYVDIDIAVDGEITVIEGHRVATSVHDIIENDISEIKHCMVHVDPYIMDEKEWDI